VGWTTFFSTVDRTQPRSAHSIGASLRREPVEEIGRHRAGMSCLSDPTDEQWELLDPVFNAPGKRGGKQADDVRGVVDAML
jgi:hypothetical protein